MGWNHHTRCAALAALIILAGGCVFDSMGLPASSTTDSQPPPEWRHDLQPMDQTADLPDGDGTAVDGPVVDGPVVDGPVVDAPTTDGPVADIPTKDGPVADKQPPDAPKPLDKAVVDMGCPIGQTACSGKCVDLNADKNNCGKCGSACNTAAADTCSSGKCVCGFTGAQCAATLNCKSGSCQCVVGGRCNGCCQSNVCYTIGKTNQNPKRCGAGGAACKTCDDKNNCTFDGCDPNKGFCYHAGYPSTPARSCDDGDSCTVNDTCAAGKCKGTAKDCSSADAACAKGVCNTFGVCVGQNKADNTACTDTFDPCVAAGKCWCKTGVCMVK